jgi:hypothetical protein
MRPTAGHAQGVRSAITAHIRSSAVRVRRVPTLRPWRSGARLDGHAGRSYPPIRRRAR